MISIHESRILLPVPGRELRVERREGADEPVLVGYAAVFRQEVEIWDGFFEQIAPGAFARAIAEDDVRALFNHDPNCLLGRSNPQCKTLRMMEDAHGLRVEITPPATQLGRDVTELVRRGDVSGMSFSFDFLAQTWEKKDDGTRHRTLTQCRLYDIGPVTYPAYPTTEIKTRSADQIREAWEAWEHEHAPTGLPIASARRRIDVLERRGRTGL